jgi:hypothetical protein
MDVKYNAYMLSGIYALLHVAASDLDVYLHILMLTSKKVDSFREFKNLKFIK